MAFRDMVFTILGIDKASKTVDEVGDSVDRLGDRLDAFGATSAKALAGTAGAAVASGLVVAGAVAASVAGFGALGIAGATQSAVVEGSFAVMAANVSRDVAEMGKPLIPVLEGIADKTQATFSRMEPQIAEAVGASAEHIDTLAEGVLGFAEHAMPGMLTAVKSAGPVMSGFKALLVDTGGGVSDFFENVSEGSEGAGSILTSLGQIVRSTMGFFGSLFANLANEGAPTVQRVADTLDRLLDVTDDLGGGSMPVLFAAVDAGLNVLNGLLAVVAPIASQLGGVLGVVLGVAAGFKVLNAAVGAVTTVSGSITGFVEKVKNADTVSSGLKTRLGGLLGVLGGPLGIALTGAAILFGVLGQRQADAEQRTRALTQALIQSHGAIDENVRSVAIQNLQQRGAYEAASKLGIAQSELTDAYLGNEDALRRVRAALAQWASQEDRDDSDLLAYADAVSGVDEELRGAKSAEENYAAATNTSANATAKAAEAHRQRQAAMAAEQLQILAGIDKGFAYEQSLRGIESAQVSSSDAQKAYTDAVKDHGVKSQEAARADLARRDASGQLNQSIRTAIVSAGELAESTSGLTSEADLAVVGLRAQNEEAIRLAQTWQGPLPAAIRQSIGAMDNATLSALGVTRSVNGAGEAVYRLPGGKEVVISAKDQATPVIAGVQEELNRISRTPTIVTLALKVSGNPTKLIQSLTTATPRAGGGPVRGGELYRVGEEGEELFVPGEDGTILPADLTRQIKQGRPMGGGSPLSIGQGAASALGASGGVAWSGVLRVLVDSAGSSLDNFLAQVIREFVKFEGGDVQAVLGVSR